MNLISLDFFVLAILTVILYFITPLRFRWGVLFVASLVFYYHVGLIQLVTLTALSLVAFFAARGIEDFEGTKRKRLLLVSAVAIITGALVIMKLSLQYSILSSLIIVPLGISYISFSLLGYVADVYWEKEKACRSILKFLLFVFFFPKITQGPISKFGTLADDLYAGKRFSYDRMCSGLTRMMYGFFKKLVIADRIAIYTTPVFKNVGAYPGSVICFATVMAAFELYCDFSGYMDIILGFSEILGFKLEENFNRPFIAKSAAEFWRRWHITLGVWFKDYVYTPIVMSDVVKRLGKWGRKNVSKDFGNSSMKVIALSAVWLLTGLWHGTGINYILWGVYWGAIIIFSVVFEKETDKAARFFHINTSSKLWSAFEMLRTFAIFSFGILLTRVPDLNALMAAVKQIVYKFNFALFIDKPFYPKDFVKGDFVILGFGLLIILTAGLAEEREVMRARIRELYAPIRLTLYVFMIVAIIFFGIYGEGFDISGFAYERF